MKFKVTGADGQTGEDIELLLEAEDAESAAAKAGQRGIFVSACRPISAIAATTKPKGVTAIQATVAKPKRYRRVMVKVGIIVTVVVAMLTVTYYTVLLPQNRKIQQTFKDSADQMDKVIEVQKQIDARQAEIEARRHIQLLGTPGATSTDFIERVTANYSLSAQQAIAADPIVPPLIKQFPELLPLILTGEGYRITLYARSIPDDQLTVEDRNYLNSFAEAMHGLSDESRPGYKVGG